MVGAGVFTTSGFALADLGTPHRVLLAWGVGAVIALCGALSYAGLARRIPRSGGEYTFLSELVHPAFGFLAGWVSLLAGFTAPIAFAGLVFESYLARGLDAPVPPRFTATAVILLAGLLHGTRLRAGARVQNAVVALKLAGLAGFCLLGALLLPGPTGPASAAIPPFDLPAFATTLVWISFSYSGWNGAVYLAGEIRDPDRNLSRALWLPTVGVGALYLALNAVFVSAGPVSALAGQPEIGAVAAERLGGAPLRTALTGLVCLALLTSISAMVMSGPRVYAQMARDGVLPRIFARGGEAPTLAVLLQAGLAVVVVWLSELAELLGYLGFTLSLSAAATVGAAVWLRRHEGPRAVPIAGYPLVPAIFVVFTLGSAVFVVQRAPGTALLGLATLLFGLVPYGLARRVR